MACGRDGLAWPNWTYRRVDDPKSKHANIEKSGKTSRTYQFVTDLKMRRGS